MRRPSLRRIFRFGLLSTLIASACVVAASSSLASDAAGCKGSLLLLGPATPPDAVSHDDAPFQRGVYVTAIKDFTVCSLGCKVQVLTTQRTLNAYIYAANGTTRGALLASGTVEMTETGNVMHFVTVNYTLKACHDYELAFSV